MTDTPVPPRPPDEQRVLLRELVDLPTAHERITFLLSAVADVVDDPATQLSDFVATLLGVEVPRERWKLDRKLRRWRRSDPVSTESDPAFGLQAVFFRVPEAALDPDAPDVHVLGRTEEEYRALARHLRRLGSFSKRLDHLLTTEGASVRWLHRWLVRRLGSDAAPTAGMLYNYRDGAEIHNLVVLDAIAETFHVDLRWLVPQTADRKPPPPTALNDDLKALLAEHGVTSVSAYGGNIQDKLTMLSLLRALKNARESQPPPD